MATPKIINSGLSQHIEQDGHTFVIEIYRLDNETTWILEIVDDQGTSHVWDDRFDSAQAALDEANITLQREGAAAFLSNVVEFPGSRSR